MLATAMAWAAVACAPADRGSGEESHSDAGLSDEARVPVLVYHAWWVQAPCDYAHHALKAFEADLELIHRNGFRAVPAEWLAEWALGLRDGRTLPARAIGITFDDGPDSDWRDQADSACGATRSVQSLIENFRRQHPDLPAYSPHATVFAIASPRARDAIHRAVGLIAASDDWWRAANATSTLAIHNHGLDHDHPALTQRAFDAAVGAYIPAAGYGEGDWRGRSDFGRIDTYVEAQAQVEFAARHVERISGRWPRLFAYPFAQSSWYLRELYFPLHPERHRTLAAFCAGNIYLTRGAPRYCLPRINFGGDPALGDWNSPAGLQTILDLSLQGHGPLRRKDA